MSRFECFAFVEEKKETENIDKTNSFFTSFAKKDFCCEHYFNVQVSLAIRGGYVLGKFSTANTKTPVLSLK